MRLIDLDAIMAQFPKADFYGDAIENMKAYPYWKTDITGLINILADVPIIEQSEDCISREEAIRATYGFERYTGIDEAPYEYTESVLRDLPPVTPQPKTGHWITKEAYSEDKAMGFTEQIVCSNCDMQNSYFSEWDECKNPISKTFIRSKFCPNCGCRMVEPQESEEKK